MGFSFKEAWQDKAANWALNLALVAIISSVIFLGLSWFKLPPQVPFFYSLPWGKEQLAPPAYLWFLPASSLVLVLVNLVLAGFFSSDKLLTRTLIITTGLYSSLASLILFRIITLII
jgi:hypothetical protein